MADKLEKYIAAGKAFGYEGKDLQEYVGNREKQDEEREERAQRRHEEAEKLRLAILAEEQKKREWEVKLQEDKTEEDRKWEAHKFELEEQKKKEEEIRRDREAEREKERLHLELELAEARKASGVSHTGVQALRPKLPKFDEQKDDMDAFLERFERFASSQGWPEKVWAVSLSPLLTGKGLQVYSSMPPSEADSYAHLKVALLKRYQLTEEGFRRKFRETEPEKGETLFQYTARVRRYFTRWTEMAQCDKTYEGLADLLLREQVISKCSTDMALFLRERAPKEVEQMIQLGEQYLEAHGGSINRTGKNVRGAQISRGTQQVPNRGLSQQHMDKKRELFCDICKKKNHVARDCFFRGKSGKYAAGLQHQGNGSQSQSSSSRGRYYGNTRGMRSSTGNWRQDCNKGQNNDKDRDGKSHETVPKEVNTGATCQEVKEIRPVVFDCIKDGYLKLANGMSVPVVSGACESHPADVVKDENLDVCQGYVGNHKVTMMRDTGCTGVAVKASLVPDETYTGRDHLCTLIDGTLRRYPIARVKIDTPYYKGEVDAMCMKKPIYDLVLGNIAGVSKELDKDWGKSVKEERQVEQASAVQTRSLVEKERKATVPLMTPPMQDIVNMKGLQKAQREDESLKRQWELAESGQVCTTRGRQQYKLEVKNEVLYRVYMKPLGNTFQEVNQIVVPTKYRRQVMAIAHESIVGGHLGIHKTEERITSSFHWTGISADVIRFCRSCDVCQRTTPKGKVSKAPLGEPPIMEEPFQRIAVDLILVRYTLFQTRGTDSY